MSTKSRSMIALINSDLIDQESFPRTPFRRPDWCGLVFNRDKHGVAGLPKDVFDAVNFVMAKYSGYEGFMFVPAVFPVGAAPTLESVSISSWSDYLAVVNQVDFFPEYYLVTPSMSFLVWVDPDATVMGGERVLMGNALNFMGGFEVVMKKCAAEFGVDVNDADSKMAAYIRAIGCTDDGLQKKNGVRVTSEKNGV